MGRKELRLRMLHAKRFSRQLEKRLIAHAILKLGTSPSTA